MPTELIIRNALIDDVPHLLPLMEQLGYPQSPEELQKRLELFTGQLHFGVLLAEIAGKAVGWVAWSKSHLFVSATTRIHIEGLVVDQNHRGKGIGKKLMIAIEEFARQFSPCIIDLTSGLRRVKDGSHDFYKSLGYHNEGHMAKLYLRKTL
ncbi:GNAT family N-acetyltransferase [Legionella pneumophila]|uniref:GNAT family N-acetyltransferase n=1 Tax=Legionella pneumophila TaxID=446 RepID=UPI000770A8E6|nr:GNAT family N-acetyltransferase [Legionella pneumophila]CZL28831.1 ribosomal-protein-alanine acetyltransferase [Legionella pneumophila]